MGLRFGSKANPAPEPTDGDGDDGDISAGEDLYAVLVEVLKQATIGEKLEIATAFEAAASGKPKDFDQFSQGVIDLFDAAAEAYDEAAGLDDGE